MASSDDLIPRSMLPDTPPPRPRTKAERIPLKKIEEMMGETKEGVKIVKKAKGGMTKLRMPKPGRKTPTYGPQYGLKKFSGGGSASSRADGCAIKGKTRGKFV